jgi:hypothetical protein
MEMCRLIFPEMKSPADDHRWHLHTDLSTSIDYRSY